MRLTEQIATTISNTDRHVVASDWFAFTSSAWSWIHLHCVKL